MSNAGRIAGAAVGSHRGRAVRWRSTEPLESPYQDVKQRTGKTNPAKSAVARKVLIAAWHVLARQEPFKPSRHERGDDPIPASSHISSGRLTAPDGIEKPGQLQSTMRRQAPKEN